MAYAYSQIFNALDPNQQQTQMQQQSGVSPNAAMQSGSAQAQKQANPAAATQQAAFTRNVAKAKSPVNLANVSSQIAANKQNLQNEANSYVQSQAQPFKSVTGEEEEAAQQMAGTRAQTAPGQTQALEQKLLQGPGMIQAFRPSEQKMSREAEMLKTRAGIEDLLREKSSPEASLGELNYGAALLGKNKEFQQGRNDLLSQEKALQTYQEELPQKAMEEAQKGRESAYKDWRTRLGEIFGSELGKVEGGVAACEAEIRQRAQEAVGQNERANIDRARQAEEQFRRENPELAQFMPGNLDASRYAQGSAAPLQQTNWQQFLNPEESGRYNRIMALMGGGPVQGGGELLNYRPEMGGFNMNQYMQDLRQQALAAQAQQPKPVITPPQIMGPGGPGTQTVPELPQLSSGGGGKTKGPPIINLNPSRVPEGIAKATGKEFQTRKKKGTLFG